MLRDWKKILPQLLLVNMCIYVLAAADRFSLLHAESQNHHHGGRMLADLVAKISPSEPLTGPQWILDQDHAESKLIEQAS